MSVQARIVSRWRRFARLWTQPVRAAQVLHGWQPISEADPADVFIVAYPKSGSTWFQSLIAGAIYGLDPEQAPDSLTQDLVPDVHYKQLYKRYRTPTFFKSHHLPRPEYRRVVYLLRDGRDVMVSYLHHLRALGRSDLDFAEMIDSALFPCKWHEHVEQWTANPFAAHMLVIRYEDLQADAAQRAGPLLRVRRGARAMSPSWRGLPSRCSFAAMQRRATGVSAGTNHPLAEGSAVRAARIIGSHADEMPPDELAAFLAETAPTLRKAGYTPSYPEDTRRTCPNSDVPQSSQRGRLRPLPHESTGCGISWPHGR